MKCFDLSQERRRPFQMDTDRASQPDRAAKPAVSISAFSFEEDKSVKPFSAVHLPEICTIFSPQVSDFGQWSTAQFGSSDQQQKFLRLMGGFKKGFQPPAGNTVKANMALGKDAQQQLQQGLLGEFERAQSRRLDFSNRGAGLGFTAPSNKKFSIDISASRSVRFDD